MVLSSKSTVRLVYGEHDEIFRKLSRDVRFKGQGDVISLIHDAGHMAVMEKPGDFASMVMEVLRQ